MRRTRLIGAQAELFPDWRYHCFATNRTVPILVADTDHRDHATVELVIRDLKDQALAHFPSGRFHANSAWTVIAALAHNLARWTTLIGLPTAPVQTAHARRRQLLADPRPADPHQPPMDTPAPRPLALEDRLHHRARRDPRAPRPSLTAPPRSPQPPADPTADTGPLGLPRKRPPHASRGNADTPITASRPAVKPPPTRSHTAQNPPRTLTYPQTRVTTGPNRLR